jgi:hypothetical protein
MAIEQQKVEVAVVREFYVMAKLDNLNIFSNAGSDLVRQQFVLHVRSKRTLSQPDPRVVDAVTRDIFV